MRSLALTVMVSCCAPAAPAWLHRTPYHAAADAVAKPGEAVRLEAWFSRGALVQKAVERALVDVAILEAGAWKPLGGARTDSEGRAVLETRAPGTPGRYPLRWGVGKRHAEAVLHVLREGETAVAFDIDGTLTSSDREVLKDYARRLIRHPRLEGPRLREHAVAAARRAARDGTVVYLTGRPPWLGRLTREWLARQGFPEGVVFWMHHTKDIWPSENHVGRAKAERLRALRSAGMAFTRAYGNTVTDISAYLDAGLPPNRIFILGRHGGERGTVALGEAYPAEEKP